MPCRREEGVGLDDCLAVEDRAVCGQASKIKKERDRKGMHVGQATEGVNHSSMGGGGDDDDGDGDGGDGGLSCPIRMS